MTSTLPCPEFGDPALLTAGRRRAERLLAPAISLLVLLVSLAQLRTIDLGTMLGLVPTSILFWAVFAAGYAAPVVADWIIFRRLWQIPLSGMVPLLRKFIGNEILLGYIGEVYFYAWARRNGRMSAAPFGAVKDVAVLSALCGNGVTLAMMLLATPFYGLIGFGGTGMILLGSVGTVLLTSLVAFRLRGRLFTLATADLWSIARVHLARIVVTTGLTALMWHVALPAVALGWWLLLATLRMLLSRLPFLPNKDIVFAGMAVLLVGHDAAIAAMMAMVASIILATHLVLGVGVTVWDLARPEAGR